MGPELVRALKEGFGAYRKKLMLVLARLQAQESFYLLAPQLHFLSCQPVPEPEVLYIQKAVLIVLDDILEVKGMRHFVQPEVKAVGAVAVACFKIFPGQYDVAAHVYLAAVVALEDSGIIAVGVH